MSIEHIHPPRLGPELGLYSHASSVDLGPSSRLVTIAGMLPVDANGQTVGRNVAEQTEVALGNLIEALTAAGAGLEDVVSIRTFLVSRDDLSAFAAVRRELYGRTLPEGTDPPPNTLVFVAGLLAEEHLVEFEALAVTG